MHSDKWDSATPEGKRVQKVFNKALKALESQKMERQAMSSIIIWLFPSLLLLHASLNSQKRPSACFFGK
jgi:hypothetical protein